MNIDFKKLAPWNWFKKEQEEQQSAASLPVQRNDLPVAGGPVSPILQLHREIDRLFDDAFRGFGFPAQAMPRWPSDLPGMLKPVLDIQETDKQYKISLEVPGVEEKDIQITLDGAAESYEDGVQRLLRESISGTGPDVAYVGLNLWRVLEDRGGAPGALPGTACRQRLHCS